MRNLRNRACLAAGPLLAGSLLTGPLLAGCATAGGHVTAGGYVTAAGHLAGRLVMEGGPMGPGGQQPGERPISGTVTITAAGHRPVTVRVGSSGAFSVPLAPGRYQVSASSPAIAEDDGGHRRVLPCSQPASATVVAGHTTTVALMCVVP
jgi:hypothetical protein